MSFSDPIQENAVTAIEKCRLAGVKVKFEFGAFDKMNKNAFCYRLSWYLVIILSQHVHWLGV